MLIFLQTLFRVWDLFFVDGLDVLFRIALGILRISEAELLHCQSISSVYIALESLPTRMWQVDKLLQVRHLLLKNTHAIFNNLRSSYQTEVDLRGVIIHADLVKRRDIHVEALASCLQATNPQKDSV